jgi:hypothetical protein
MRARRGASARRHRHGRPPGWHVPPACAPCSIFYYLSTHPPPSTPPPYVSVEIGLPDEAQIRALCGAGAPEPGLIELGVLPSKSAPP